MATSLKDARNRPQTPQDFSLLQTLRYKESTGNGAPPLPKSGLNSSHSLEHDALTSPVLPPSSHVLGDVKRDSGIAPSPGTSGGASYAEEGPSSLTAGASDGPRLPTVVVQDESPSIAQDQTSGLETGETTNHNNTSTTREDILEPEKTEGPLSRISSGSTDNVELGDLVSEKIAFSARGSLLLSGKKINKSRKTKADGPSLASTLMESPGAEDGESNVEERATEMNDDQKQGLTSGPRSANGLAAPTGYRGSRVLSADEMTLSTKVRNMYEHVEDQTANSTSPAQNTEASRTVSKETRDTPIDEEHSLQVEPSTPNTQLSHSRDSIELPETIADWDDIDGRDVDRYGFINPKRRSSLPSSSDQAPRQHVERVATSLRIESEQRRKTRKKRSSMIRTGDDRVASIHSSQNGTSTTKRPMANPFRSKTRRVLAEAPDMLSLPPGLSDSAEQQQSNETVSALKLRERSRENKWQSMAKVQSQRNRSVGKGGGMQFEFDTSDPKLISRTWKGIPDRWRATAWHSFLSSSAKKRGIGASDEELISEFHKLQEEGSAEDVQIDMDVPRTINLHIMFRRRYRGGQRLLFRVLHAISLYFPEIGYVQGMGSLAATLLCYFEEERAFIMMVRLWQLRGMQQLFQAGFEGLMKALEEFEKDWLKQSDVAKKLEELGITSTAYGTRWYLTLFNLSIPFPAQLRVWDVFMLLGDGSGKGGEEFGGAELDVLHATSAALIDATREIIIDSDFENAMKVLTSFIPIKDEDVFMRVGKAEWKLRKKRATKTQR